MSQSRSPVHVRRALPDEAEALTALCLRSKAHWGYDMAFMAACRHELEVTADALVHHPAAVAQLNGHPVGYAELRNAGAVIEIDKLFVDPPAIGRGAGQALFDWARTAAAGQGARVLTVLADPNAAGFYRRMGMIPDGEVASANFPGRMLPRLVLELA